MNITSFLSVEMKNKKISKEKIKNNLLFNFEKILESIKSKETSNKKVFLQESSEEKIKNYKEKKQYDEKNLISFFDFFKNEKKIDLSNKSCDFKIPEVINLEKKPKINLEENNKILKNKKNKKIKVIDLINYSKEVISTQNKKLFINEKESNIKKINESKVYMQNIQKSTNYVFLNNSELVRRVESNFERVAKEENLIIKKDIIESKKENFLNQSYELLKTKEKENINMNNLSSIKDANNFENFIRILQEKIKFHFFENIDKEFNIEIKIFPPSLGEIKIDAKLEESKLKIKFHIADTDTAIIFRENKNKLLNEIISLVKNENITNLNIDINGKNEDYIVANENMISEIASRQKKKIKTLKINELNFNEKVFFI